MIRLILPLLFCAILLADSRAEEPAWLIPAGETLKVGVLTVDASKFSDRYNESFTSHVHANLRLSGVFEPLSEEVFASALAERRLSLPRKEFGTAAVGGEVGRIAGVDHVIVTSVGQQGTTYSVTMMLVRSSNDRILEQTTVSNISPLAIDFEPALTKAVTQLVELVAEPEPEEQVVEGPIRGMVFARIEGGFLTMGSERGDKDEQPVREVNIDSFELMTTEVTQAMWMEVLKTNPSKHEGMDHPVERVTLDEIKRFIVAMNILDSEHFYRLPSEAEWEYAARAGKETQFPFGDDAVGLDFFAWFKDNSEGKTHSVGTREPNEFGLYDMLGNVFEYCVDSWYSDYREAPLSSAARINRSDPNGDRVIRGGSYTSSAWKCRPASRLRHHPNRREEYVGLRLARSPK